MHSSSVFLSTLLLGFYTFRPGFSVLVAQAHQLSPLRTLEVFTTFLLKLFFSIIPAVFFALTQSCSSHYYLLTFLLYFQGAHSAYILTFLQQLCAVI